MGNHDDAETNEKTGKPRQPGWAPLQHRPKCVATTNEAPSRIRRGAIPASQS